MPFPTDCCPSDSRLFLSAHPATEFRMDGKETRRFAWGVDRQRDELPAEVERV